jgi:hypothetical protein
MDLFNLFTMLVAKTQKRSLLCVLVAHCKVTPGVCLYHNWPPICSVCGNHNPFFFSFMIYNRCVTRVTRLVAHVEQERLTVPEYIEVIHVLELGSCVSKTHNTMAKRQNTYNGCPLVSVGHCVVCRFSI